MKYLTGQPRVLAMIMAGGKGERLMPLTAFRSKPAVPFAGRYRIVDFVLSNFLNSGILSLYVLVQYRSQSLIEHLRRAWRFSGLIQDTFITVVPPQMKARGGWYEGTADAVHQNLNLIRDFKPDLVAVFGADHVYRMDIGQMIRFHHDHNADVTVAALPVPLQDAHGFGIVQVGRGRQESRVTGFEEKPKRPKPMPGDSTRAYSSMGNYLFNTDLLVEALERDAVKPGSHDFGRAIIPGLIRTHRVMAYNFLDNAVPGLKPYEERGYWRDVGTLDAYWQAHMDLLGERPIFDLRNRQWPILTDKYDGPAAHLIDTRVDDALIEQSSQIVDARITRSMIGRNVRIEPGAVIEESIIMDGSFIGAKARLRRVIADRFNLIAAGSTLDATKERTGFTVTKSGLIVLPRGQLDRTGLRRSG